MRKRQKCHFIRAGHCLMTMITVWGSTSYAMFHRLGETLLRFERRCSGARDDAPMWETLLRQ